MNSDINNKIEKLHAIQNSLEGLRKKVDNVNVEDYWVDSASEAFSKNLKNLKTHFIALDNKIDETVSYLRQCKSNEVKNNE